MSPSKHDFASSIEYVAFISKYFVHHPFAISQVTTISFDPVGLIV
jgi:hypothetical protein